MIDIAEICERTAPRSVGSFTLAESNDQKAQHKVRVRPLDVTVHHGQFRRYEDMMNMAYKQDVCQYQFEFSTRFAIQNGMFVIPQAFAGDTGHLMISNKDNPVLDSFTDRNMIVWTTANGKFVHGYLIDALFDPVVSLWVKGTSRQSNQSISPLFLVKCFHGEKPIENMVSEPEHQIRGLNEAGYDKSDILNFVHGEYWARLHSGWKKESAEKIKAIINQKGGYVGKPLIEHEPSSAVRAMMVTDENFVIAYQRGERLASRMYHDIYKLSAMLLAQDFNFLRSDITPANRPFGTELPKYLVRQALEDEDNWLCL